jgi:hypothetical protein
MSRALLSRIERLEAKRSVTPQVIGIIGGMPPMKWEEIDGVFYIRPPMTPEEFAAFASQQQSDLIATLTAFAEQDDETPDPEAPQTVGKTDHIAPHKPGTKRRRYLQMKDGSEIELKGWNQ